MRRSWRMGTWRGGTTSARLFGLLFVALGIAISVWGAVLLTRAKASVSWPSVEGKIIAASVKTQTATPSGGRTRATSRTYKANVSYEYSVGGTRYSSDKVSFGEYGDSDPEHARGIVGRYPAGKTVQVYYNPEKPDVAVLEPGASWSSYVPLGVGILFALAGVAVSLGGFVAKKRQETLGIDNSPGRANGVRRRRTGRREARRRGR